MLKNFIKIRLVSISVFIFLATFQTVSGQNSPKKYLEDAISLMKLNSVNKAAVDWTKLYDEAMSSIQDKKNNKDVYSIIIKSLDALDDHHSGFYPPEIVSAYMKTYRESGLQFPYPKDSLLNGNIGYITVPAIGNLNQDDWNLYVGDFYNKLKALDSKELRAWVIDVRENDGGMFSPMYKAIQPFLDRKKVIGSKDNGGIISYYKTSKNNILFANTVIAKIDVPMITLSSKKIPIYILVSKKTASSGEFVTAAFVGQKNATIIGVNTQGLTSDNSEFRLSDGAILKLTTGILVDRERKEYSQIGKGITPDIEVISTKLKDYISKIEQIESTK
ncbi:C-terminal processing protease CtpA/Prc [Chryseobacterium vietnamense]|nr:C-terminal processing protease CtpA/Prc [Chryseobacterium vietnamense]